MEFTTKNYEQHFTVEAWTDFARGVGAGDLRGEMERHLQAGCAKCGAIRNLWGSVLEMAGREADFNPPEPAVRIARALYRVIPPQVRQRATFLIPRLIRFESALAGVRALGAAPNQYFFQAGTVSLDFCLQRMTGSSLVAAVGQVVDCSRADGVLQNRPVRLLRTGQAGAQTVTNEVGEFRLEFMPGDELLLTVELENGNFLVAALFSGNRNASCNPDFKDHTI